MPGKARLTGGPGTKVSILVPLGSKLAQLCSTAAPPNLPWARSASAVGACAIG